MCLAFNTPMNNTLQAKLGKCQAAPPGFEREPFCLPGRRPSCCAMAEKLDIFPTWIGKRSLGDGKDDRHEL